MPMAASEQTIANIGPRGRRRRTWFGWIGLAIGAALVATLVLTELPRAWRWLAMGPFLGGALGIFQARAKT